MIATVLVWVLILTSNGTQVGPLYKEASDCQKVKAFLKSDAMCVQVMAVVAAPASVPNGDKK